MGWIDPGADETSVIFNLVADPLIILYGFLRMWKDKKISSEEKDIKI